MSRQTPPPTHWNDEPEERLERRIRRWAVDVADDSPLYRSLALTAADDPDLVAIIAETPRRQPIPLSFLAAVHFVLASHPDAALAAWYPTVSGRPVAGGDPAPAFRSFVLAHRDEIAGLTRNRLVQTNEVGRCALLLPALARVAAMARLPLAVVDVGCSAGLNLRFDDYRYVYSTSGGQIVVDPSRSDVELTCDLTGDVPPLEAGMPPVAGRVGLDQNPLDVTREEDAAWIRALVWPDQRRRHERLAAALRRAAADPPTIVKGDALEVLPDVVGSLPRHAAACVVHSHVMNQLESDARDEFDAILHRIAEDRPCYRIASEWLLTDTPTLELTTYDGPSTVHVMLGQADKHGAWLDWTPSTS
jgi:hypothetical protein